MDTQDEIDERLAFAASRGLTSVVSPGDPKLVKMVLDAADRFEPLPEPEQRSLIEGSRHEETPVPTQLHH